MSQPMSNEKSSRCMHRFGSSSPARTVHRRRAWHRGARLRLVDQFWCLGAHDESGARQTVPQLGESVFDLPPGRVPLRGVSDLARRVPVSRTSATPWDTAPGRSAPGLPSAPCAAPILTDAAVTCGFPRFDPLHRSLPQLLEAQGTTISPASTPPTALAALRARVAAQSSPNSKIKTTG